MKRAWDWMKCDISSENLWWHNLVSQFSELPHICVYSFAGQPWLHWVLQSWESFVKIYFNLCNAVLIEVSFNCDSRKGVRSEASQVPLWENQLPVSSSCPAEHEGNPIGKILLGGKCPFVRTKKIVRTNFFVSVSMPSIICLYYFLSIRPLISCLSNCCPYLCLIVQQAHGSYFRNILILLRNNMGVKIHNLSHKTMKQVTKHSTQNSIS